jgi:hypothetical protein
MDFFLKPLDRAESDPMVNRISENFARHGFGIWAVEAFWVAEFIGATGLSVPRYETHFTPCEPEKRKGGSGSCPSNRVTYIKLICKI